MEIKTLNDLKKLKKDDKIILVRDKGKDIDTLGYDIVKKLSTDITWEVRNAIARYTHFSDILKNMMYDSKKNWKKWRILDEVCSNKSYTTEDRIEFLKSRVWEEPSFPFKDMKYAIDDNIDKEIFTKIILQLNDESPVDGHMLRRALWGANDEQKIKIVKNTKKEDIRLLFDCSEISTVELKLLRSVALKNIDYHSRDLSYYPRFFYSNILNNSLYKKIFGNNDSFILTISYENIEALLNNKMISKSIYENMFIQHMNQLSLHSTDNIRKYKMILMQTPLNPNMEEIFNELIDTINISKIHRKNREKLIPELIGAYVANPTASKENIDFLHETYNIDNTIIIIGMNKSSQYTADDILTLFKPLNNTQKLELFIDLVDTMSKINSNDNLTKPVLEMIWGILIESGKIHKENYKNSIAGNALFKFFTSWNYEYQEYIRNKELEYFLTYDITDWVNYSDAFSPAIVETLWNSSDLKDLIIGDEDPYQPRNIKKELKKKILLGKYGEHFGVLYFKDTNDGSYLPADIASLFLI